MEQGSELGAVVIYLNDVRHLVVTLVEAATPDCLIVTSPNLLTDCLLYLAKNHRFTTIPRGCFDLTAGLM
jgi:hypothetical protein